MRTTVIRPSSAGLAVLSGLVFLAGCMDRPRAHPAASRAHRPAVLSTIPVYPRSIETDTTGTDEVERGSWIVQRPFDALTAFYRDSLPKLGWHLMSDEGDRQKLDLYAKRDTLNLWVHIEALGVMAGRYTIIASTGDVNGPTGPIGKAVRPPS
jgi:hypothetical protein